MTNEDMTEGGEPMSPLFAIDALLDGEPVDQQALRLALDDVDARDYLVEALLLRGLTREMGPPRFAVPGIPVSPFVRRMRWLAAGLILAVTGGTGYFYGQHSGVEAAPLGVVEVAFDTLPAPPAPEPTRSIRFEAGVNWTTDSRSH
jgi:hypothetical protein